MTSNGYLPKADRTRRAFLHRGSLILAGATVGGSSLAALAGDEPGKSKPAARLGLLTDIHYADRSPAGTRHYRDSLAKVQEAIKTLNKEKAERLVHLGDLVDTGETLEKEIGHLRTIEAEFAKFHGPRNYVLGNHCVWTLTKEEFLENTAAEAAHVAFDHGPFHCVLLDACYRADGVDYGRQDFDWTDTNIPKQQIDWLRDDLAKTDKPTIVFVHQRLDGEGKEIYVVNNAEAVRAVLEKSGKVLAVIMGHSHQNSYREVGGIHYCVLRAVIEGAGAENSGYSLMDLFEDGSIKITGFRKQATYAWRT
ncbi:metallophosphoesterase [Pirellulales bacterium]|nr:metallophosphoesterase [Pirellulales bacterium]